MHYVQLPASLEFRVVDSVTEQPVEEPDPANPGKTRPMLATWGLVVRALMNDERVLAKLDGDQFELNDLRMKLTRRADRVTPLRAGDVVELTPKEKDALAEPIRKSKMHSSLLASGALEMMRVILDAPTVDPRTKSANGATADTPAS